METDQNYYNYYKKLDNAKSINEIFVTLIDMRKLNMQITYYIKQLLNYIKDGVLKNELLQMENFYKRSIEKRYNVRFLTESEQLELVNKGSVFSVYIENPSFFMKNLIAMNYNKQVLYSNKGLMYEVRKMEVGEMVEQNGLNIKFLNQPSIETQLIAIKQNGCSIQYINNPSIEVQLEAVKNDSMAIKYIKEPTIEVLMESVRNDPFSIQYIYDIPLVVQLQAVKLDGDSIKYIKNFSVEVAMEAVRNSETAIKYVKNPSLEIQMESIRNHLESIKFIKKPYKKVVKLYNEIKSTREEYQSERSYKFRPTYEKDFKYINNDTFNSYIIDWKDDLSKHINYLCQKINAVELNIATGFALKSGFQLIKESIKYILNNNGNIRLIIGSLEKYNEIINSATGKVIGMDCATAEFINELLDKGVIIKTFIERFYHGKFYLIKGENCHCIIMGSSNLSASGFKKNKELNILYVFHKENHNAKKFLEFFETFWDECIKINKLELEYFNIVENEIHVNDNLIINKIERSYIENKIQTITDEEIKRRLKVWLSKNPDNIYNNLDLLNLKGYVLFQFKKYNLLVLESFEAGNSYYYFHNYDINSLLTEIQTLTKTEIFSLSGMPKRGYHIKNNYKLEFDINNLFSRGISFNL